MRGGGFLRPYVHLLTVGLLLITSCTSNASSSTKEDKRAVAERALSWILGDAISTASFFKDHWAKKELHIQRGDEVT